MIFSRKINGDRRILRRELSPFDVYLKKFQNAKTSHKTADGYRIDAPALQTFIQNQQTNNDSKIVGMMPLSQRKADSWGATRKTNCLLSFSDRCFIFRQCPSIDTNRAGSAESDRLGPFGIHARGQTILPAI